MWDSVVNITSWAVMAAGAFFMLSGAVGVLRMPGFFNRVHPAGVIDSCGAPLILLGVALQYGFSLVTVKILLLIFFLLITNPTATHALCQAVVISQAHIHKGRKK